MLEKFYDALYLSSVSAYWKWLEEVATPGIHLARNPDERHVTNSYLMGVARLRQIRSQPGKMFSHDHNWIRAGD